MALSILFSMEYHYISVVMLSVAIINCCAEFHYAECCYAECHYAECRDTECHYAECRDAECRDAECSYAECRGVICLLTWTSLKSKALSMIANLRLG
jgi:hypothetical protein